MDYTNTSQIVKENSFNPEVGLPEDLFLYVSSIIPMVNVDLLIKDEKGKTLLSWRDDEYTGKGWHIPGGIIRYKETAVNRIVKVKEKEIGDVPFYYSTPPIAVNEIIVKEKKIRGHFISLLYNCHIPYFFPENKNLSRYDSGYLQWFDGCPDDILCYHEIYRRYIDDANCRLHL